MAAVDDVYESWEDMDDIGLDRKITNFLSTAPDQCTKKNKIMSSGPVKVVFDMNGSIGAQLMSHQPAVKILKRPVGVNGSNSNGECKARPVKTFQQRQQEYEQARLRILGEARSPEDVAEENITNLQLKMEASCIQPNNRIKEKPAIEILSPKVSLMSNNTPPLQPRILTAPPLNLISLLRSPRGPDGTKGFTLKR